MTHDLKTSAAKQSGYRDGAGSQTSGIGGGGHLSWRSRAPAGTLVTRLYFWPRTKPDSLPALSFRWTEALPLPVPRDRFTPANRREEGMKSFVKKGNLFSQGDRNEAPASTIVWRVQKRDGQRNLNHDPPQPGPRVSFFYTETSCGANYQ